MGGKAEMMSEKGIREVDGERESERGRGRGGSGGLSVSNRS